MMKSKDLQRVSIKATLPLHKITYIAVNISQKFILLQGIYKESNPLQRHKEFAKPPTKKASKNFESSNINSTEKKVSTVGNAQLSQYILPTTRKNQSNIIAVGNEILQNSQADQMEDGSYNSQIEMRKRAVQIMERCRTSQRYVCSLFGVCLCKLCGLKFKALEHKG